ncbi:MAG TPA: RNA 2'-phosphotransferase [Pirellulales bacterium]|nr:RNA 2'-phosphotransferase [Pirellulales bacterium]
MNKRLVTVSKFLSKHLRHEPETLGLRLATGGWVLVEDVLAGSAMIGFPISREELEWVVAENDKRRFAFDEKGLRNGPIRGIRRKSTCNSQRSIRPSGYFMEPWPGSSMRSWPKA